MDFKAELCLPESNTRLLDVRKNQMMNSAVNSVDKTDDYTIVGEMCRCSQCLCTADGRLFSVNRSDQRKTKCIWSSTFVTTKMLYLSIKNKWMVWFSLLFIIICMAWWVSCKNIYSRLRNCICTKHFWMSRKRNVLFFFYLTSVKQLSRPPRAQFKLSGTFGLPCDAAWFLSFS